MRSERASRLLHLGLLAAVLVLLGSATPLYAQRDLKDIPDSDPEIERQSFLVADGFTVNLFAADPLLAKPIQMNFDPDGRLWVVSSEVYPQILPGQVANDKVLILEDQDGDGRSDKTTVFADGLLIPTGIEPGDGGAYVGNSTELLHLKDTDGDGKADTRRVLLSGFGTEDTHHIIHTLRWGYDGNLYFNQSTYIHSHVETPWGVRRLGGGGIWQFRPEAVRLEVFTRGLINPWGHHFDRWGQSFATDGAGNEGINYMVPGASYAWTPGAPRILTGLNPGSPKYCGLEVLSGRHLPEDWRGDLLTNDFRANRVCRFQISEDGSGFAARERPELIKTRHVAFRPIDVKMGPDGAIYIADWYNPIIQHGEVDFRDPRRDHTRGRIWRVTAQGRPLVARPKLRGAPMEQLLDALKTPEDWTRQMARRLLKEHALRQGRASVARPLAAWVQHLDPKDPEYDHHRLETLWVHQAIAVVEPKLLTALLTSGDPRIRAAATRVVGAWSARLDDPLALLAERVRDDHPRVRLEAVRALAQIARPEAAVLALQALDQPTDRFLDYALWLTARELAPTWLPRVQAGTLDLGGAKHLLFALEAVGTREILKPLMDALRAGTIPADRLPTAARLVAATGGPEELAQVLEWTLAEGSPSRLPRADLLDALAQATAPRKVRPAGDLTRLGRLLAAGDEALRAASARAIGVWGVTALRPRLAEVARDPKSSEPLRRAAIEGLASLGGEASRHVLDDLCRSDLPMATRRAAVVALAEIDPQAAAERAVAVLADDREPADPTEIFASLMRRKGGPEALAKALEGQTLPADVAKIGLRAARSAGRGEGSLINALQRAGRLASGPVTLSPGELEKLVEDVKRLGDPARGEAIFRRADLNCLKCHAIAGAGGQVGPGLESIGASAPIDYLITSLLDPNKAIKEGYHSLVVATDDGRVLSGIKLREADGQLVLRDAEDQEIRIPLSSIEAQKPGGSLMPSGLTDSLTRAELIDLVRFLSELGKVGPYAVGKARVVRRWQALEWTPETRELLRLDAALAAARDTPGLHWSPRYSRVSGDLPLAEIPRVGKTAVSHGQGIVRCQVDVTTSGRFRLVLNSAEALRLWVDGTPVDLQETTTLDLPTGLHTLTFALDLDRRHADLRCELEEDPGSAGKAQIVGGK
ncbi:MAG: HEAT repeat domain-containing protein [Isosphaeraceae bacterium]|nr:HEAT repeat domain-containing protein [Isosphaeraceae bacterium]